MEWGWVYFSEALVSKTKFQFKLNIFYYKSNAQKQLLKIIEWVLGGSDDFFASKNMPLKWSITERGSRPNISILETTNSLKTNKTQVNDIIISEIKNQEKLGKRVKKKQKEEIESENGTFFGTNKTRTGE